MRNNLKIYKSFEVASTFIELCKPKKEILLLDVSINSQGGTLMNSMMIFLISFLTDCVKKIKLHLFLVILTSTC